MIESNQTNESTKFKQLWETLSYQEKKVLYLISEGLTTNEIANYLSRSIKTITNQRSSISQKLKIKGPFCLFIIAARYQLWIIENKPQNINYKNR